MTVWGMGGLSTSIEKKEYRNKFRSDRGIIGVNYMRYINSKSYIENIVSYSATRQTDDSFEKETGTKSQENFTNQALRISFLYNHKLNARNTFRLGMIINHLDFSLFESNTEREVYRVNVNQAGNTQLLQAYGQWKFRLAPAVTMHAGVHGMLLTLNNQYSVEPRAGLKWSLRPGHSLSFGSGLHSKTESISTYFAQINTADGKTGQLNKNLKLTKSAHFVFGYEFRPSASWRFQSEVYYQHHFHVPIGPPGAMTLFSRQRSLMNEISGVVNDSLVSEGKGRSYGIELTIEKSLTNGIYFMSTTSLYESKYTGRDGIERDSRFAGKYVQNILGGKEWKVGKSKANIFAANIKLLAAGGNRTTPFDIAKSKAAGKPIRDWSQSYAGQLPGYFRTDIRISYTKNKKRTTSTLSLDIQNVTNRLNAFDRNYDVQNEKLVMTTQTGLLPILNYRLEF